MVAGLAETIAGQKAGVGVLVNAGGGVLGILVGFIVG
jgi:hypothetical protein